MRFSEVILDTNLSLLLIVGLADRSLIGRHKRLRAFDAVDFGILQSAINASSGFAISPNIATEISNLLNLDSGKTQHGVSKAFARFVSQAREDYVPSTQATLRREFSYLGLSDAVILEMANAKRTIFTADAKLHIAAQKAGLPSENFNHWRDRRPDYQI